MFSLAGAGGDHQHHSHHVRLHTSGLGQTLQQWRGGRLPAHAPAPGPGSAHQHPQLPPCQQPQVLGLSLLPQPGEWEAHSEDPALHSAAPAPAGQPGQPGGERAGCLPAGVRPQPRRPRLPAPRTDKQVQLVFCQRHSPGPPRLSALLQSHEEPAHRPGT